MSSNSYKGTGALVLDKLTPVIDALFEQFTLAPNFTRKGNVYIATIAESDWPTWKDIRENLVKLAKIMGLGLPNKEDAEISVEDIEDDESTEAWLKVLLQRFGEDALEDAFDWLDYLPGAYEEVSLKRLFELAGQLNDGHGLKAIRFEAGWYGDQPCVFEFGGNGDYVSRNCTISTSSRIALSLGAQLDEALNTGDIDNAATLLLDQLNNFVDGIAGHERRDELRQKIALRLAPNPSPLLMGDGFAARLENRGQWCEKMALVISDSHLKQLIETVLHAYSLRVTNTDGKSFETMASELIGQFDVERVAHALLRDPAQGPFNEVKEILTELEVLEF